MFLSRLRAYLLIDPLIILSTMIFGTLSLLASAFDKTGHTQNAIARVWARVLLAVSGSRTRIEGLEKLPGGSCVLVSNHESYMDIPAVLALVPLQIRFFAKKGLFRIPLLGGHLRRAGHLPVERDNPRASVRSLAEAARLMRERNVSVLIFPEGGRSPDGLREFIGGAAHLAIKAGVPAVPVALIGTRQVLPMDSLHVSPHPVTVRIGEPIMTANLKLSQRSELNDTLRCRVSELLGLRSD